MIIETKMKNGTKFSYEDGKFDVGKGILVISKLSGGNPDIKIALSDLEIMKLLRFITNCLVKI